MKKQSDINQLIRQLEPKRKIIETRLKNVLTRHGKLREKDIGVLPELVNENETPPLRI